MGFDSSVIQSADYDPEARTLDVAFTTGRHYRYFDVPESEYGGLITASSAGAYFNTHIRDQYDFIEIEASRACRPE
jgi:lysyl-tRNA synthetase class 2